MGKTGTRMTKCERLPGLNRDEAAAAALRIWRASMPHGTKLRRARCSNCDRPWPVDMYERHATTKERFKMCPRCQWASRLNDAEAAARAGGVPMPERLTFQPSDGLPHYNPHTAQILPPGPGVFVPRIDTPDEPKHVESLCGGPEIPFPGGAPPHAQGGRRSMGRSMVVDLSGVDLDDLPVPGPGTIQAVKTISQSTKEKLADILLSTGWTIGDVEDVAIIMNIEAPADAGEGTTQ